MGYIGIVKILLQVQPKKIPIVQMELLHVFAASHYGECRILSLKLAHLYSSRSATTFQTRFLNTVLKRVTLLLGFYIVIEPFITGLPQCLSFTGLRLVWGVSLISHGLVWYGGMEKWYGWFDS